MGRACRQRTKIVLAIITRFLQAINEKVKELDFHGCKVRVLNVDCQEYILIFVIGEISNQGEPSRKFVQTFVLAE